MEVRHRNSRSIKVVKPVVEEVMSISSQNPVEASPPSVNPHSLTARFFHWGFIGVFAYALTKQLDEVEELEDFSLLQQEMAFATFFLVILFARFLYMRSTRPTALPGDSPEIVKVMASSCHIAMYVSLAMIAISGLMIGGLYWSGIKSGGAMFVVLGLHEISVNTSYFLIGLHVAGAIYHRRKRDGIWSAMVPVWKGSTGD